MKEKTRKTLAMSDGIYKRVVERQKHVPRVIRDLDLPSRVTTMTPAQYHDLGVDERYQRVRIGPDVNELIQVLKSGGTIPDPIDVVERPDGSRWIIDGQQRFWAFSECNLPMRVHIHKIPDLETEKLMFQVLNQRRPVSPQVLVKSWPGPTGEVLRAANGERGGALENQIDFGNNTSIRFGAAPLARGLLAAMTGQHPQGHISRWILPRADREFANERGRQFAKAYLLLVAGAFSGVSGRVKMLPLAALGRVAYRRWIEHGQPTFPPSAAAIGRINWDAQVPSHAFRFLPLFENAIERRWR